MRAAGASLPYIPLSSLQLRCGIKRVDSQTAWKKDLEVIVESVFFKKSLKIWLLSEVLTKS